MKGKKEAERKKASSMFKSFFSGSKSKKVTPTSITPPTIRPQPKKKPSTVADTPPNAALAAAGPQASTEDDSRRPAHINLRNRISQMHQRLLTPAPGLESTFLSEFEVAPASFDDPGLSRDDLWEETINSVLHRALGYGEDAEMNTKVVGLKPERLQGFIRFVDYFTGERGLDGALFEGRLARLADGILQGALYC